MTTDPTTPRVAVWACPERPGPSLDRRNLTPGGLMVSSYGWTWWSARHIVLLPDGMSFLDAIVSESPVEVTVWADVDPLASGLNETHQRYEAEWCSRKPEQRLLDPGDLLAAVEADSDGYFRLMRDIDRREHGLPRAVVRSDRRGQPLYFLRHDWPDGTFVQGGTTSRPVQATPEEAADADVITYEGRKVVDTGVFIEAFPRDPSTFLRGEGPTFAAAEDALWAKWERIVACPTENGGHEYETRGYTNGLGFCRHCNLSTSGVFDLAEIGSVCVVCGVGTNWSHVARYDADGQKIKGEPDKVCEEHCPPTLMEVQDAMWAAEDGDEDDEPMDLSWVTRHLREGTTLAGASVRDQFDAIERGQRDLVDAMIRARQAGE